MKSIRTRLVGNFMFVIMITVVILEIFLINIVKEYCYSNVEAILTNQIKLSSDFYSRYFSMTSLKDNVLEDVDVFWEQTASQVQIIDLNGNVLMDSIGASGSGKIDTTDYKKAVLGEKGKWIGKVEYDTSSVMAVSYPLKSENNIVGVLRFVTSLRRVNNDIKRAVLIIIGIGGIVVLISGIVSIFLAGTIIKPLREVTQTAEKLAQGKFNIRSLKKYDDEIGKLSDTLNFMSEEILKKEQLKNEFISSVSHELRTPLTSIKGWAITLNTDEEIDREMLRDGLEIIEKESDRLTLMVEELLDFSKFVSGKIKLQRDSLDIEDIIKHIEKQMTPRAERDGINFATTINGDIPEIYADENRIKQVLINLLDNAFKFTHPGGNVSLQAEKNGEFIRLIVKDNGCGISNEELPRVKEKFFKGKSSKSQNGIGLSICDEIIRLHDGSLEIKSKLNEGTEAVVSLPYLG